MARNWWGTRQNVSSRLRLEVELMQAAFGETFRLEFEKNSNILYWLGQVEINLKDLRERLHHLKIIYPSDYPSRPPEAYILHPYLYSKKHQFEDGQLCLFNPKDGVTYGWNPSTSTAVTVAAWAVEWIYSFYTWKATGEWPGVEERLTPGGLRRGERPHHG
jgi:ubiquitin-protein ligase